MDPAETDPFGIIFAPNELCVQFTAEHPFVKIIFMTCPFVGDTGNVIVNEFNDAIGAIIDTGSEPITMLSASTGIYFMKAKADNVCIPIEDAPVTVRYCRVPNDVTWVWDAFTDNLLFPKLSPVPALEVTREDPLDTCDAELSTYDLLTESVELTADPTLIIFPPDILRDCSIITAPNVLVALHDILVARKVYDVFRKKC